MAVRDSIKVIKPGRGGSRKGSGRRKLERTNFSCLFCGQTISSRLKERKFCGHACMGKYRTRNRKQYVCVCANCGTIWHTDVKQRNNRYCSAECVQFVRVSKALRYRQIHCRQCSTLFYPRQKSHVLCSMVCVRVVRSAGKVVRDQQRVFARQEMALSRASATAKRQSEKDAEAARAKAVRAAKCGPCWCGKPLTPGRAGRIRRYCSRACYQKEVRKRCGRKRGGPTRGKKHTSRARRYGVPYCGDIKSEQVYERDGWICRLCGQKVSRKLLGLNLNDAPAVDHIIPLSVQGSPGHVWSNVQCSHRICNSRKSNRVVGQIRMF